MPLRNLRTFQPTTRFQLGGWMGAVGVHVLLFVVGVLVFRAHRPVLGESPLDKPLEFVEDLELFTPVSPVPVAKAKVADADSTQPVRALGGTAGPAGQAAGPGKNRAPAASLPASVPGRSGAAPAASESDAEFTDSDLGLPLWGSAPFFRSQRGVQRARLGLGALGSMDGTGTGGGRDGSGNGGGRGVDIAQGPQLVESLSCNDLFPSGEARDSARLLVELSVDEAGRARVHRVLDAGAAGPGFILAAEQCAARLRFRPARDEAGRLVQASAQVRLRFSRDEG